ncbi:DUF1015 domain-containing protein [Vagococcus sp. BWB3-3]|uniref:DUF1015 domain-containing protein n=1 Tax=Vagococcus allomyrinae TaxID=2794353 RepID=A0A940P8K5_9ENTE|nr:DUF1015 family protein [Vagococcus allomyrinae]MBP1043055.1 DUF1015 domain-containing protein [Vagococcus allomyrinae]
MVVLRPFKGIRPEASHVAQIATHPYDVLNSQEAAELAQDNPYSYLHIDKAEIDLPSDLSPYDEQVYQKAASNLAAFLEKGWFVQDETPALYLYELTMDGRAQTGIVATTAIDDYAAGHIKKHEYTRHEKEIDRINHIDYTDANTSPIFLTYRQQADVKQLIAEWQQSHQPIYDFDSFYDVKHRVWMITDPQVIAKLVTAFKSIDYLYIADGHHRTESAVKVGLKRRESFPKAPADSAFNYFLSVIFPKEELAIWDYNRVLQVPIPADLVAQLAQSFVVTPLTESAYQPQEVGHFGMYVADKWYDLAIKAELIPTDAVGKLDAALLQQYVFEAIFKIDDIRTDKRIDFVGGIRGIQELERLVDSGDFSLAFSLYPTSMDQLLAVADADQVMPPKSTWFEPKLLSGLFLHDLETPN